MTVRARTALLLGGVFAVMLGGCATLGLAPHGPAVPPIPSQGGPAWTEVTSDHFVLWTDAPAARGRELVQQMEHHRQVVLGAALHNADSKVRVFVLALRDAEEVGAYVPPEFIAYSMGNSVLYQPVIVLAANTDDHDNHIITHELTHVITFGIIPNQPHWFAEGIAGYFETARLDLSHQSADLGNPLDYVARELRGPTRSPPRRCSDVPSTAA